MTSAAASSCNAGWSFRSSGPLDFRPIGETEAVAAAAQARLDVPLCQAIIGYADLRLSNLDAVLAAHMEAGEGRFRGIRQSTALDPAVASTLSATPPPGLMGDAAFRRGIALLGRLGLVYDAWLYHPQLPELIDLVRAEPSTMVVLDHMAGPLLVGPYATRASEEQRAWADGLRQLAAFPNVVLKIGGLGRVILGFDFHERPLPPDLEALAAAWRPFVEIAIEAFGADRCMFESNFPVDKGMCSYTVLWNALKRLTRACSTNERDALFFGTAARIYGILEDA